jgi:hypothetical protein
VTVGGQPFDAVDRKATGVSFLTKVETGALRKGTGMTAVDQAVRELEQIQMALVRVHAHLAGHPVSVRDRHQIDSYFDAFASNLTGLEEYLRGMTPLSDAPRF